MAFGSRRSADRVEERARNLNYWFLALTCFAGFLAVLTALVLSVEVINFIGFSSDVKNAEKDVKDGAAVVQGLREQVAADAAAAKEMLAEMERNLSRAEAILSKQALQDAGEGEQPDGQLPETAPPLGEFLDLLTALAIVVGGYEFGPEPYSGGLQTSGKESLEVNLESGHEYLFVGLCDDRCEDLDLHLYGGEEQSELLGRDELEDARPLVVYTPNEAESARLTVTMKACDVTSGEDACKWEVYLFSREGVTDDMPQEGE